MKAIAKMATGMDVPVNKKYVQVNICKTYLSVIIFLQLWRDLYVCSPKQNSLTW